MPANTLQEIEARLSERKNQLMLRIERVKDGVTAGHSADWSEQAQERQNDEVLEAIGNESRSELSKINTALERIKNGEYNTCSQCGSEINIKRLEAVPYTSLCIKCASNE